MRPQDILPDDINTVSVAGVDVRKGSVAAFIANVHVITDPASTPEAIRTAEAHLLELMPSLNALRLFEVFAIRDDRVRRLVGLP